MADNSALLKVIPFRKFDKWYAEYYLNSKTLSSKYPMMKLGMLITPVKRRIKKANYDGILPVVSKIVFKTGKIIFRNENKTGMDLLHVKKGDLLVSSINFHQGAVALNDVSDFVCSTHYQTFCINESIVIPQYLICVLRTTIFIEMVAGIKANGIKNESGYDFISNLEIPIPSLTEQKTILEQYRRKLDKAATNIQLGNDFCADLLYTIQSQVSNLNKDDLKSNTNSSILQTISFSSTNRWEVNYIFKEGYLETIYNSFQYPCYCISQLITESLFGLSLKAVSEKKDGMIPMLRMSNIINGEIDFSELKYLPQNSVVKQKEPNKWLLSPGDFLVTRTNGSKDLVGKAAIFNSTKTFTYASYLIRYRFNTELVLPAYINIMFMTPLVREQIAVMRRQGGGQYNLNSDEIGAIRIPVPPLAIQKKIIDKYYATKDGANLYYEKAAICREEANQNFGSAIFLSKI